MDPAIHRGALSPAGAYRRFARVEAHGSSKVYEDWAGNVAEDPEVLELVAGLPRPKRQPNLVFAAARLHGADGAYASFRSTLVERWDAIRGTALARSTQTNEAARCAVLLPFLAELPQPLALIEVVIDCRLGPGIAPGWRPSSGPDTMTDATGSGQPWPPSAATSARVLHTARDIPSGFLDR